MKPEDEIDSDFNYEEEAANSDVDSLDEGELNPAASPQRKSCLIKQIGVFPSCTGGISRVE